MCSTSLLGGIPLALGTLLHMPAKASPIGVSTLEKIVKEMKKTIANELKEVYKE